MKDYVFKDSKNTFWVLGCKECVITKEAINDWGFIRLVNNHYSFLSLNGLKASKKYPVNQVEYFQFFVTENISDDCILVNFRNAELVNGKNFNVFDINNIEKLGGKTTDKTRLAGREVLDNNLLIGKVDPVLLESLDKPLLTEKEVEGFIDYVKKAKPVFEGLLLEKLE